MILSGIIDAIVNDRFAYFKTTKSPIQLENGTFIHDREYHIEELDIFEGDTLYVDHTYEKFLIYIVLKPSHEKIEL